MSAPKAPSDLAKRGATFWNDVVSHYSLRTDELELLAEACRCLDRLDEFREAVARDGLTVRDPRGGTSLHPCAKEERQVRLLLRLVLSQLALPDEAGETDATKRGRAAADARWARSA